MSQDDDFCQVRADFLVPEGAVKIEIMPALFQVKSGVIDYDEFILEPIDAAPIVEKKKKEEEDLEYILSLVKQSIKKNKK